MDPTAYTLLLAMGAALCAAFISGWLLHMMVTEGLFWVVVFANLAAAPVGLLLPWYCSRRHQWMVVPTLNIFSATLLSILVSIGIVLLDRGVINKVPTSEMMSDEFIRTLIAVAGIAMATSLVVFLLHYTAVQEASEIRRVGRKVKRFMMWEPVPKLTLCDDLETVAPGECAICLDELASLPVEAAYAPPQGAKARTTAGLLRLPCQHTFHGSCAARWLAREVNCPMCRKHIGNLGKCVRICLRGRPACSAAGAPQQGRGGCPQPSSDAVGAPCAAWVLEDVDGTAGDVPGTCSEVRVVVTPDPNPKDSSPAVVGNLVPEAAETVADTTAATATAQAAQAAASKEAADTVEASSLQDISALRVLEADGDEELP